MKNSILFSIVIAATAWLHALPSKAQINEADTSHWQYRLSGTGIWLAGNIEDFLTTGRAELAHNDRYWGVFTNTSYTYREADGQTTASEIYSRNIGYLFQRKRVYPFLLGNYWRSRRRGINAQFQVGPGIAWRVVGELHNYFRVGGALLYENTTWAGDRFHDFAFRDSVGYVRQARGLLFISGAHAIGDEGPRIVYEVNWQPSLQYKQQRWYSLAGIEVPVSRHLALRGNLEYIYENVVLDDRQRMDLLTTFGLTFTNAFSRRERIEMETME